MDGKRLAATLAAVVLAIGSRDPSTVRAMSPSFCAAYIHPGDHGPVLSLFPIVGAEETVPLPEGLPPGLTLNAFSPDGKAIYVQKGIAWDGIIKIEFKPTRQSVVPGSMGMRTMWHLTVVPSGRIYVSGANKSPPGGCGTFEIDTGAGSVRTLRVGAFPDCGGGGGAVSPDGKRLLSHEGKELSVVELETGAVQVIRGIKGGPSPTVGWIDPEAVR